jgi:ribonuclease HI
VFAASALNTKLSDEGLPQPHSLNLWEKPPLEWKKVNWDAALDLAHKRMSTGVVIIRDEDGLVVAASMAIVPFITDPTMAEAVGPWHALTLCRQHGFARVIFEGDSQMVVSALQKNNQCWSSFGQIIEDTRHCFPEVQPSEVRFVRLACHQAAHSSKIFEINENDLFYQKKKKKKKTIMYGNYP